MNNYFCFKNNKYGKGTVVQVREECKEKFKFYSHLVFEEYDNKNKLYCFKSLYDKWDSFEIPRSQIAEYIEQIAKPQYNIAQNDSPNKVNPNYIEGIVSAWIWYILIMIFGLFLKGPILTITVWTIASIMFFSWRHKKINGE